VKAQRRRIVPSDYRLNPWKAEFRDLRMERGFRLDQSDDASRQLASLFYASAPLLASLCVMDWVMFGTDVRFQLLAFLRAATAASLCMLAWLSQRVPARAGSGVYASLGGIFVLTLMLVVSAIYPLGQLPTLAQGLTLFILVVYLMVPNRWVYCVVLGFMATAAFLAIAFIRLSVTSPELYSILILLVFANGLGAVSCYRSQVQQRRRFLDAYVQRKTNVHLRRAADTDVLTGLLNRRRFFTLVNQRWVAARSVGTPCSVMFIDIDHFKAVNDRYGHAVGDACLRQVSEICHSFFRGNDLIGRIGGEEFGGFLEGANENAAAAVAERLRSAIERPPTASALPETPTITIGISQCRNTDNNLEAAFRRADEALYRGKREGRNRVIAYSG